MLHAPLAGVKEEIRWNSNNYPNAARKPLNIEMPVVGVRRNIA
jgi:hypothetical protein